MAGKPGLVRKGIIACLKGAVILGLATIGYISERSKQKRKEREKAK